MCSFSWFLYFKKLTFTMVGLFLIVSLASCAATMSAVEHAKLETSAKMSDTIFLTPTPQAEKTVFVQVKNTSDVPIRLQELVIQELTRKGYKVITDDPYKAHYWLQANVLYMGEEKKHLTADAALTGGYGGALLGAATGRGTGRYTGAAAGALIGSAAGTLIGSAIHVDTYMGVVDIQVKEKILQGTVATSTQSNLKQGIGTTIKSSHHAVSNYQAYR
ncbi:MAG: complement resistance protein TraT, partial [Deltaproteobacteria bacterium]|nr:complement resistance protein TraT [Deltaproteobacteria bacterium]